MASVGISILLIGLVVYYFNVRLRALERTAQKQNQVLASFIGGVQGGLAQGELRAAARHPVAAGGAAPGAVRAAQAALCRGVDQCAPSCIGMSPETSDKIQVSDDEEHDDDDVSSVGSSDGSDSEDSDSYSDDSEASGEIVSVGGRQPEAAPEAEEETGQAEDGVKVIDLGEGGVTQESLAEDVTAEEVIEVEADGAESETPAEDVSEVGVLEAKHDGKKSGGAASPESMKVPELRDLVVEKELATAAEARGMKKARLVALLEPKATSEASE